MESIHPHEMTTEVDRLNRMLRRELAAADAYARALDHVASPKLLAACKRNRASHASRVHTLGQLVAERAGSPARAAGAWGAFVRLLEHGAALLGEPAVVRVLEEAEAALLRRYIVETPALKSEAKLTLVAEIIPAERESHKRIRTILHEPRKRRANHGAGALD